MTVGDGITARVLAASYVGGGQYAWLVRVPNFAGPKELHWRLCVEHLMAIGLSHAHDPKADAVRDARSRNYASADRLLSAMY